MAAEHGAGGRQSGSKHALPGYARHSYRHDPSVPEFPDERPLIVFDGVCVLCSGFARFVIARDKNEDFLLTHAQSELGQALFRHYGLDSVEFETNLLIDAGFAYGRLEALALIFRRLGWPWRLAMAVLLLPRPLARWLYQRIARNRYALFGRRDVCWLPAGDHGGRFIA